MSRYTRNLAVSTCLICAFVFCITSVYATSLFPSAKEIFGNYMPAISSVISIKPVVLEEDGIITEKYAGFTDENYNEFDNYLASCNCNVIEYEKKENSLHILVGKGDDEIKFVYDRANAIGMVSYLGNTRPEKEKTDIESSLNDSVGAGRNRKNHYA